MDSVELLRHDMKARFADMHNDIWKEVRDIRGHLWKNSQIMQKIAETNTLPRLITSLLFYVHEHCTKDSWYIDLEQMSFFNDNTYGKILVSLHLISNRIDREFCELTKKRRQLLGESSTLTFPIIEEEYDRSTAVVIRNYDSDEEEYDSASGRVYGLLRHYPVQESAIRRFLYKFGLHKEKHVWNMRQNTLPTINNLEILKDLYQALKLCRRITFRSKLFGEKDYLLLFVERAIQYYFLLKWKSFHIRHKCLNYTPLPFVQCVMIVQYL